MDIKTQLAGVDQFLTVIYGSGTSIEGMLGGLGFEADQVSQLRERGLPAIATAFIDVIRKS